MAPWRDSAVILVGHGSARNIASAVPTRRLACELRSRKLFAEVFACFWKEPPRLGEALSLPTAQDVFVVPNFAGEGYYTQDLIPREMGLDGRLTLKEGRRVWYTDPVGTHAAVAGLISRAADEIIVSNALAPADTCLLLIGHGSGRPGGSASTAEALAATLRRSGGYGEVRTAYLEQEPRVEAWTALTRAPNIIAAPLLIAEGLHGSEDLPPLFGLAPGQPGPGHVDGRRIWYCRGIGGNPEIVDIILDQIRACAGMAGW